MKLLRSTMVLFSLSLAACTPSGGGSSGESAPGLDFEAFGQVAGFKAQSPISGDELREFEKSLKPASCQNAEESSYPAELKVGDRMTKTSVSGMLTMVESRRVVELSQKNKIVYGVRYLTSRLDHPLFQGNLFVDKEILRTCLWQENVRENYTYWSWECDETMPEMTPEARRVVVEYPEVGGGSGGSNQECSDQSDYENERRERVKGTYTIDGKEREALLETTETPSVRTCKVGSQIVSTSKIYSIRASVRVKGMISLTYPSCYASEAYSDSVVLNEKRQLISEDRYQRTVHSAPFAE